MAVEVKDAGVPEEPEEKINIYYGEVHSHSTESDGKGSAPEAYEYARDVGKADYFALTDHNIFLEKERFRSLMPPLARRMNAPGSFAALYGYEMSYTAATGYYGHLNIIGSEEVTAETPDLPVWYSSLAGLRDRPLGQFNHPGEKWGDFDEFRYDRRIDDIFNLIELRIDEYGVDVIEEEYERCLSKGWHVGPVSNEDTHAGNWTTAREECGAVLAETLSAETIADAMRRHRTYATTDRTLKLICRVNGHLMGDVIPKTGKACVTVEISTQKPCGIGVLELVGESNRILASVNVGGAKEYRWSLELPDDHRYLYVRRVCATQYAVSAPVWIEQPQTLAASATLSFEEGATLLCAEVRNTGDKEIEVLSVEWIPHSGRILPVPERRAYAENAGAIGVGESRKFVFSGRLKPSESYVTLTVCGRSGGEKVRLCKDFRVCPLTITRTFVNTARPDAVRYYPQPFCCFDVYNDSDAEVDLSAYTFRAYARDAGYKDIVVDRRLGAHKVLTVWFGGKHRLDVGDFCRYFGLDPDSTEVYRSSHSFEMPLGTGKILICHGNRTMCRAWIRFGAYKDVRVPLNGAFVYERVPDSATLCVRGLYTGEKPGLLPERKGTSPERVAEEKAGRLVLAQEKRPEIGKALYLCDVSTAAEELYEKIPEAYRGGERPDILTGSNTGATRLDAYMRKEGWRLLCSAARSPYSTVLLALGGGDCGRSRCGWLSLSCVALSSFLGVVYKYLSACGKRVIFLPPEGGRNCPEDYARLCKAISDAAGTVGAECSVDRHTLAEEPAADRYPALSTPCPGAIAVACVGDRNTQVAEEKDAIPYPELLAGRLDERYDVRVYAGRDATAVTGIPQFFEDYIPDEAEKLAKEPPACVVIWLSVPGPKFGPKPHDAESFAERCYEGLKTLARKYGKHSRVILVTPLCCENSALKDDAAAEAVVRRVADECGAWVVDLNRALAQDDSLFCTDQKGVRHLTKAGNERLAEMIGEKIREILP